MFILGNTNSKEIIKISGSYANQPSVDGIKANAVDIYGGTLDDYSVYVIDDDDSVCTRISNTNDFVLIWESNNIVGLDFSIDDNKKWLSVIGECDSINGELYVKKDGIDSITVKSEILLPDKSGRDVSYNESIMIPISTPNGIKHLYIKYTNGYNEYIFNPVQHTNSIGNYNIPSTHKSIGDIKIATSLNYKVVIPIGV